MSSAADTSRIIIENVYPEIDGGRYPAKRCVGDLITVSADIFMEGHDLLKAAIMYRDNGDAHWGEAPMLHVLNDRWEGTFPLTRVGMVNFTIKAWPDHFGTWQRNAKKSHEAGQDVAIEAEEGRLMLQPIVDRLKKSKHETQQVKDAIAICEKKGDPRLLMFLLSKDAADVYAEFGLQDDAVPYARMLNVWVDRKLAGFGAWYEMVPRSQGKDNKTSGTFADCEKRLPEIRRMGFDVVYLPPIHPIGVSHRKGKNNSLATEPGDVGSMYAVGGKEGGHKAVHPDLGTLEDFQRFVKTAKSYEMDVALDFAAHVSRDHPYIKEHPEWFSFRPDGSLRYAENPPKKYEDIANFNWDAGMPLWQELKSVFEFWIKQGVTIFRIDNPHTKPFAFWEWLIREIQDERPDILFLAEAFTRPKIMDLLAKLGFSQSYTYFTWRNTKQELIEYMTELARGRPRDYFRPNFFPTTPDIFPPYLHKSGRPGFIVRLALAATLAGNYGVYNGYELCEGEPIPGKEEYLDSEKYEIKTRDWDAPGNIKPFITKLNAIRRTNPALANFTSLRFHVAYHDLIILYSKTDDETGDSVFVAVNLDPNNPQEAFIEIPLTLLGIRNDVSYELDDLLLGHSWRWTGARQHLRLDPTKNPVAIFRIRKQ